MKTKSSNYWINRANARAQRYDKNATKVVNKMNLYYNKALDDLNKDIEKIFYKFAKSGDLTKEQALELLNTEISTHELDSIRSRIGSIKDKDLKKYLTTQLNYVAYKARITRLQAIKESIKINIGQIADVELAESTKLHIDNMTDSYYRSMFDIQKGVDTAFNFSSLPVKFIEETLKSKWSGKNYSERVWNNNRVLATKLQEVVTSGLMSGKSSNRMAKELEDQTMYGRFATERLIRTETTYVTNQGELESYKSSGIEKYIFVATLDLRTSSLCRKHDRKEYPVSEAVAGENLPPLHAYCRSTTRAKIEGMELGKRIARDPLTGETYQIDNMSYEEWHQKFVVEKYGEQNVEKLEKMVKNKSTDWKQYQNYKVTLGKEAPQTFEEFRKIKYFDKKLSIDLKTPTEGKFADVEVVGKNEGVLGTVKPEKIDVDNLEKSVYNNGNEWEKLKLSYKVHSTRNYIKSVKQSKELDIGQQNKHIVNTNEYKQKADNLNKNGQYGPSYLTIDDDKIKELINNYSGTGEIKFNKNGIWNKKETIISSDELVGKAINNINGNSVDTTVFKIHYGKKGVHIVPDYPSKRKEK